MRLGRGRRAAEILHVLSRKDGTGEVIAKALKAGNTNVASLLLRLFRSGHVDRKKIQQGTVVLDEEAGLERPRHVYLYSITPKGEERLAWLMKDIRKR